MSRRLPVHGDAAMPLQRPGTWLRQSDDENVIVDTENSALHVLNDTALALWVLCTGQNTVGEMITAVVDLYGEPREVVRRDVESALAGFDGAGLLLWEA